MIDNEANDFDDHCPWESGELGKSEEHAQRVSPEEQARLIQVLDQMVAKHHAIREYHEKTVSNSDISSRPGSDS